jgi:hypothetical protein
LLLHVKPRRATRQDRFCGLCRLCFPAGFDRSASFADRLRFADSTGRKERADGRIGNLVIARTCLICRITATAIELIASAV